MKTFFLFALLSNLWASAEVISVSSVNKKAHVKSGATIQALSGPGINSAKSAFIGYLKIPAKGSVPEHRDETEEYIFITKGEGKMWIDDKEYVVKVQDLVFMPANSKVKFEAKTDFEALQMFAPSGPERKYKSEMWK
jgi:quercetin dioxygenase-like cupin family protein